MRSYFLTHKRFCFEMALYGTIGAGTVLTSSDILPPPWRLGISAVVGACTAIKAKMSMGDQKKVQAPA